MYSFIKGTIESVNEESLVLECNNIGYNIIVNNRIKTNLPLPGKEVKIFTYFQVREDALNLYGFLDERDRKLFKLLISVNKIGPKNAMNLLDIMTADEIAMAIASSDDKKIASAKGIGKNVAAKIILELKDKIDLSDVVNNLSSQNTNLDMSMARNEAVSALTSLGYSPSDSLKAVNSVEISSEMTGEDILKKALRFLAF